MPEAQDSIPIVTTGTYVLTHIYLKNGVYVYIYFRKIWTTMRSVAVLNSIR